VPGQIRAGSPALCRWTSPCTPRKSARVCRVFLEKEGRAQNVEEERGPRVGFAAGRERRRNRCGIEAVRIVHETGRGDRDRQGPAGVPLPRSSAGRDQVDVIVVLRERRPKNPSAVVVVVASASPRVTAASSLSG